MATSTVLASNPTPFRRGIQAGITIAIGYMPIALTFGLLAKSVNLTIAETVMMSIFVFAGASQYMALNMIALGTGAFEIIMTTFIVNIRHFLMSATLNERVEKETRWKKALYSFGITDETFSVAATKEGTLHTSYMFGLVFISYASWVVFSGIGHVIGGSLPSTLQDSMSIALYAMFVGLLVPSMKKHRKVIFLAATAAVLNGVFVLVFNMAQGWAIIFATLISAVGIEWLEQRKGMVSRE